MQLLNKQASIVQTTSRPQHYAKPQAKLLYTYKCTRLNTYLWNTKSKRVALATNIIEIMQHSFVGM